MTDEQKVLAILEKSNLLSGALELVPQLKINDWYIAAGVVSQTVWNHLHGYNLTAHIKDIDLVYFDTNTSYEAEDSIIQKGKELFKDIPVEVEIRNQARVHLWAHGHYGKPLPAFTSTQEAIGYWLTTPTCVGVTMSESAQKTIYSAYGLSDLLGMHVRPNRRISSKSEDDYRAKTARWKSVWPKLTIEDW